MTLIGSSIFLPLIIAINQEEEKEVSGSAFSKRYLVRDSRTEVKLTGPEDTDAESCTATKGSCCPYTDISKGC